MTVIPQSLPVPVNHRTALEQDEQTITMDESMTAYGHSARNAVTA